MNDKDQNKDQGMENRYLTRVSKCPCSNLEIVSNQNLKFDTFIYPNIDDVIGFWEFFWDTS